MKVYFYTLGCKVNQYETQALSESLRRAGYEVTSDSMGADIYIVNSCTVTSVSDQKTRQAVRRFKRQNPQAVVVLTGCMPQAYPQQALKLLSADIVLGNKNNSELIDLLNRYFEKKDRVVSLSQHMGFGTESDMKISSFLDRTRAFVKIQDGCDRYCSYCIIPTSRGRSRSKPLDVLKEELEEISKNGFKEIVLVGINLSCYGLDINADFAQAVELACSFDGIQRVRLGSLEPEDITDDVIKRLARLPKLCPSFHISLQSGSDSTLKRMNRHYTTQDYQNLCDKIKAHFKDASFTTDVMVGFPHETDEDFVDSLKFVKTIGFHKVHVFPYSARSGTKAAQEPQIPKAVKDTRRRKMIELADEMKSEYLRSLTGKTFSVLFETGSQNVYHGYTKSYIPVKVISTKNISDHIERVKITGCDDECCTGEIVDEMARI